MAKLSNISSPKMDAQQRRWQAEDDANALALAAEIKADKKRMTAAAKVAQEMQTSAAIRAKALKSISKKG